MTDSTENATLYELVNEVASLNESVSALENSINVFYLLIMFPVVFTMSAGFSMLEAGSVRQKNVRHLLTKTAMTWLIGIFTWYFVGFGESFGWSTNGFIGTHDYLVGDTSNWPLWVYQSVFLCASATVLSGAVAERITMWAYLFYVFIYTAWVYPVFAHWTWGVGGWLHIDRNGDATVGDFGVLDFAGGAPVHLLGGTVSLVAVWIIGPRISRFTKIFDDTLVRDQTATDQVLGMWLLWFGWFAFNTGSSVVITGQFTIIAGKTAANTLLCPAVAGLTAVLVSMVLRKGVFSITDIVNGVLGGLVAITPACGYVDVWSSFPIGVVAALFYHGTARLMNFLKLDDPVDAVAVHMACGLWGVLATGFFAARDQIAIVFGVPESQIDTWGAFLGGGGLLFGLQVLSATVCMAWGAFWGFVIFYPLRLLRVLRVSEAIEMSGLDMLPEIKQPQREVV